MRRRPSVDRVLTGSGDRTRPFPDALAAVVVVGAFWLPSAIGVEDWPRLVVGSVLASVTGGAMMLRWRLPAASTATAAVATVAGSVLEVCQDPMLATAWCLYAVAIVHAPRTRTLVLVFAGLLAALAGVTGVPEGEAGGVARRSVLAVAGLSVAWVLGTTVGRQIAIARETERARVHLAVARDVHDEVGHALGLICAEAGVARAVPDATERELRESLADVEAHARRALEEMQALIRALRAAPAAPPDPGQEATTAGLPHLSSVVAMTRAAGIRVDARIGRCEHVDDAVGAAVFRIVQEALSNVVRHASGAACAVDVHEDGATIVVHVRDNGPGARTDGGDSGFGLRGMRERARLVGGTVAWKNSSTGGFEVEARLPVRRAR